MAASLPGQMPFTASPVSSEFDAIQNSALRKKKLAEMLQQQVFAQGDDPALHTPGAKMSFLNPLAKMLSGGLGSYMADAADKEAEANAMKREAAAQDYLGTMPRATPEIPAMPIEQEAVAKPPLLPTPPVPAAAAFGPQGMPMGGPRDNEFRGSASPMAALLAGGAPQANPLAPPPVEGAGGPPLLPPGAPLDMAGPGMLPKLATDMVPGKAVDPADAFKWAAGLGKFGANYAKVGDVLAQQTGAEMFPKPVDPYKVAGDSVFNTKKGVWEKPSPATLARQEETRMRNIEKHEEALRGQDVQSEAAADRAALRRAAAAGSSGGAGVGTNQLGGGMVDDEGKPLAYNGKTNKFTYAGTDKAFDPSKNTIHYARDAKVDAKSYDVNKSADLATNLAERILKDDEMNGDKGAFGTANNVKSVVNNATAGFMFDPSARLTPEQQELRASVSRDFAKEMHDLYGSAFTSSEQERARDMAILPGMSAKTIAARLQAQSAFRKEMAGAHKTSGGGTTPAAGGGAKRTRAEIEKDYPQ